MIGSAILIAIDTATRRATLALGDERGRLVAARAWRSEQRPGALLHAELDGLLREADIPLRSVAGIVAGTGPGSFTGLRVGLATAKVLAHALDRPIVGVATTDALALAAAETSPQPGPAVQSARYAVALPAGVADRYLARVDVSDGRTRSVEQPRLLAPDRSLVDESAGAVLVAVDLEPAEPDDSTARVVDSTASDLGRRAVERLGHALLRLGALALEEGRADDRRTLVPAYVALPRGITEAAAGMSWSPDLR